EIEHLLSEKQRPLLHDLARAVDRSEKERREREHEVQGERIRREVLPHARDEKGDERRLEKEERHRSEIAEQDVEIAIREDRSLAAVHHHDARPRSETYVR